MKHIKTYQIFERIESNSFLDACEKYLSGTPIWESMMDKVKSINPELAIEYKKDLGVNAQFDLEGSSNERIVILVNSNHPNTESMSGTIAHELTHALQFLRDGDIDLFVTDATRAFSSLSKDEIWEDLMLGIYLVDPIEIEAWSSEVSWHESTTLDYMIDWMKRFDPADYHNKLVGLKPLENEWDLQSFEEFPSLWGEVYYNYNDGENLDPDMVKLGELDLLGFLESYDQRFKTYKKSIGI